MSVESIDAMFRWAGLARRSVLPLAAAGAVGGFIAGSSPLLCKEAPPAKKKKLTVAELIALKGKRQVIAITAFDEWTARAAEEAGVDLIMAWGSCPEHRKFVLQAVRKGAPNTLIGTGIDPEAYWSREEALKRAAESQSWGADLIYASGMVPEKFAPLSEQHYPCGGHAGYRPVNDTCKLLSVP